MIDKERIKQMAVEAGIGLDPHGGIARAYPEHLERFAQAVARECAEIAERADSGELSKGDIEYNNQRGLDAANAIRARFGLASPPGDG